MKKVFFIVPSLLKGGAERVVSILSKELSKYYQIYVIIYHYPVEYEIEENLINLNTPSGSFGKKIFNIFYRVVKLKRLIKEISPDFIVSVMGNLPPILSFQPVILRIESNPDFFPWYEKLFLKTVYKLPNVKKIITCSSGMEKKLAKDFHLKNLKNIYNPIDFNLVDHQVLGPKPLHFDYILAVGRLNKLKGFDILIESFAQSALSKTIKLVILGEGAEKINLEGLILRLNLKSQVLLLGKVNNPFIYMKHAKYFILSSRSEGFVNVLLEALACEIPVIATNCETGIAEVIKHEENGLLVPVGDQDKLISALERLYNDTKLYERLKANTRRSVEKFNIENIAKEWVGLFKELSGG